MKQIYLIDKKDLIKKKYFIKFIDEVKDEVIIFIDKVSKIRIFSSICPHFGGEIYFDYQKDLLRCKWHDWRFSKLDGKCSSFNIKGQLKNYGFDVKPNNLKEFKFNITEDKIYLEING
jgi:nitrite reductase/ring-hydroxylating ferredoxin subunit|tara:strand:- start:98 stop:451 length:354 start_codon:yes stop_codon:yes gene_type:complete